MVESLGRNALGSVMASLGNIGPLAKLKGQNRTTLLGLIGATLVGIVLAAASLLYPIPERGPDVTWRGKARLGGIALTLLAGGGAVAFYKHHLKLWQEAQDAINQQAAGYITVSLAPRSDQKPVDPTKIDLWQRVGAYIERPDQMPSPHLVVGWVGTQDSVYATMACPPELRQSLGVQLNSDFPNLDVVEVAATPGDVPEGDEDEMMVSPAYYLQQGAVHWQELVLSGDDSLQILSGDGLKRNGLNNSLLSMLDGVPAGETWGLQILVRAAPAGRNNQIYQAVEQRQLTSRGSAAQGAAPITSVEREMLKAKEGKAAQTLFEVILRPWAMAAAPDRAQQIAELLSRLLLSHLKPPRGAGLQVSEQGQGGERIARYVWPTDTSPGVWGHQELAGLFHLPGQDVAAVSAKIVTARARKLQPVPAIRRAKGQAHRDLLVLGSYRYPSGEEVDVGIPWNDTKVHCFVVGPTGSGKSTTLGNVALEYVEHGATVVMLEPHGDLVKDVAVALPPELVARTIYVNPLSWAPPAMNVCSVGPPDEELSLRVGRTMEILMAASGEDWSKMVRLAEITRNGLALIMAALGQEASLVDLRRVLIDEDWRYELLDQVGLDAQEAVSFWRDQFPEWSGQGDAMAPVMRRLSPILSNGIMRPMLGLPGNTLDIGGFLDRGMLVLVPLMAGSLQEKNKNTLGTLVMQQILTAILSRAGTAKDSRGLVGIFIDEFPDFIGSTGEAISILLAQARKFGASVILAAQSLSQLASNARVMTEVRTNCRNKVVYASDDRDAKLALDLLGAGQLLTPADMVSVGKYRGYVRSTVDRAPVPPAYVRFLPPVGSIKRSGNGRQPDPLAMPPHPGKRAMRLAEKVHDVYRQCEKQGEARKKQARRKIVQILSELSDDDWARYKAGRVYLFAREYNEILQQPVPSDPQAKAEMMQDLTAYRIGIPVYERDIEYQRRLGSTGGDDDWGDDFGF